MASLRQKRGIAYSSSVVDELGGSLFNEALNYYRSEIDYQNDPNADKLRPELYEAMGLIEMSGGKGYELSSQIKFARYELHESFEALVNDIYPSSRK